VLALQSGSWHLSADQWHATQQALRGAFPRVRPCFGFAPLYGAGMWSWTHCSRDVDALAVIAERAAAIARHTRYYNEAIHRAAFALPNELTRGAG
jgi:spermidine synthase